MSQPELLRFVTDLLPTWRVTRRRVLALGCQALVRRRRLTLCGLARGLDSRTRVLHRVKRLWRFLSNPGVDPREVVGALTRRAFRLRREGWVPIIFDETGLKERAMLLCAGTWYRGRALPLAMYAYQNPKIKKSLWAYREGLLSVLWQALSKRDQRRFLLIADRGYGASAFFRRLVKAKINFAIRVPRKVLFSLAHQQHRLEFLAAELQHGDCYFLTEVLYGPANAKLNLLLWWEPEQPEPWLIATTLPTAEETKRYYRLRMGIEELFKDLKGTFALESGQCQSTDRITRLGLFALVALWALIRLVRYPPQWVRYVTARGALSFLTLALEWLDAPPHTRHALRQEAQCG
jgi:DDE family transposase